MDRLTTYMESESARRAFARIFCALHGTTEPRVPLADCAQWAASAAGAELISTSIPTLFVSGVFLNTSTPVPRREELANALAAAAGQIIVPNVRRHNDTTSLSSSGFIPVPAGDESIVFVGRDWERTMRESHGPEALYEMKKSKRRADAMSTLRTYALRECPGPCLDRLARLLIDHEVRYGHQTHLFTRRYLDLVRADDELGPKTYVAERVSETGESIQAMIWLEAEDTLFYITQASDRSRVDPKINIYKASYADLYVRANQLGLEWVNISRGNSELKRRIGATVQYPQDHWVRRI